jgi:DNA-binding response OmpR family regulator
MSYKRIVLIDDELDMAKLLKMELELEDYRVDFASDGRQGLALINQVAPDLVLLDIMMPEMDGYEVLRQLKKEGRTQKIPVVFLTAKGLEQDIQKGLDLGAEDYIIKPVYPALLLRRIKSILRE